MNAQTLMTKSVIELVAIGAAMASPCEPCFKYHYDLAHKLGVSKADMRKAVEVALAIKATPHLKLQEAAERFLAEDEPTSSQSKNPCACGSTGCC